MLCSAVTILACHFFTVVLTFSAETAESRERESEMSTGFAAFAVYRLCCLRSRPVLLPLKSSLRRINGQKAQVSRLYDQWWAECLLCSKFTIWSGRYIRIWRNSNTPPRTNDQVFWVPGGDWGFRRRKLGFTNPNCQKAAITAASLSTSIVVRIMLLNAIMLAAVLFTATVFRLPKWARAELHNMQKQFLWQHSTSTVSSRHKVNPGLLYKPRGRME